MSAAARGFKTEEHLEEAAIIDTLRTFIAVQARDWQRRQQNALVPRVLRMVDEARANGDAVDVPALIQQVWLDRRLPAPAIEAGE